MRWKKVGPVSALATSALLASLGADPVALDPVRMGRIGRVDGRFQSYNVEMVEVTGGRFWAPYEAESGPALASPLSNGNANSTSTHRSAWR